MADTATRIADDESQIPDYLLNDCHIWWPDSFGSVGFVASATVSPSLIAIVFAAYDFDSGDVSPVASLSLNRAAAVQYRSYALTPLAPGVGGWAAVGSIPSELVLRTWHVSSPESTKLLPRLAHGYPSLPVTSLGKQNGKSLIGRVTLLAGTDLEITKADRVINGQSYCCVVIALAADERPELYRTYAGPCGGRLESGTCGRDPIVSINGVVPDSDGLIYIDVDDAAGILLAEPDDPVEAGEDAPPVGVRLITTVDVDALCPLQDVLPAPVDLCEVAGSLSSLSSSSQSLPPLSSSSSISAPQITEQLYDFSDANQLRDFSMFDEDGLTHCIDWLFTVSDVKNVDSAMRLDNGLAFPVSRTNSVIDNRRRLFWNAGVSELNIGDYLELELGYGFDECQFGALDTSTRIDVMLHFSTSIYALNGGFSARIMVTYEVSGGYVEATAYLQEYDGSAWNDVDTLPTQYFDQTCFRSSSSSLSSSLQPPRVPQSVRVRIERTGADTFDMTCDYGSESGSASIVSAGLVDARFVGFSNRRRINGVAPVDALDQLDLFVNLLSIRGTSVELTSCDEENFNQDAAARVIYGLQYDPDGGWSNDFGTTRALQQFDLLPEPDLMLPASPTALNGVIDYGDQYLTAGTTGHKYGVLRCQAGVLDDYVVSAAFRFVSGEPKVGILIGFQNGSRDYFWAVVIDLAQQRITYGQHYIGHAFQASTWVDIVEATAETWSSEWHRLVVRVFSTSGGAPYSIAAWIDPDEFTPPVVGLSKTIEVDYGSPNYLTTGKTQWTSGISSARFADGPPGIYVYGGEAQIAEFTVSPVDVDIVVPNKVPWLPR